jgi:hypothetical protein
MQPPWSVCPLPAFARSRNHSNQAQSRGRKEKGPSKAPVPLRLSAYMRAIIASPNLEQLTSVAPGIRRAKS